jgi:hypothetical protein
MTTTASWSAAINPELAQRLWRPVAQPGAIDGGMGDRILTRHRQFLASAPLLDRCLQRQVQRPMEPGTVPIVYALPSAIAAPDNPSPSPPGATDRPPLHSPLIRAKLDPAGPSPLPLAGPVLPPSTSPPSSPPTPDQPLVIQAKLDPTAPRSHPLPAALASAEGSLPPASLPTVRPASVPATSSPAPLQSDARSAEVAAGIPLHLVLPIAPASLAQPATAPADRPVVRPRAPEAIAQAALPQAAPGFSLPLVQPAPRSPGPEGSSAAAGSPGFSGDRPDGLPIVPGRAWPPESGRSQPPDPRPELPPALDLNQLADQVERRLKRNLIIDRERRGWQPWA